MHELLALQMPWLEWNEDRAIVFLSAKLSIAFISVAMIYGCAIRFARWLVAIASAWDLLDMPQKVMIWAQDEYVSIGYLVEPGLTLCALVMLFMPASNRWMAKREAVDASTFE